MSNSLVCATAGVCFLGAMELVSSYKTIFALDSMMELAREEGLSSVALSIAGFTSGIFVKTAIGAGAGLVISKVYQYLKGNDKPSDPNNNQDKKESAIPTTVAVATALGVITKLGLQKLANSISAVLSRRFR